MGERDFLDEHPACQVQDDVQIRDYGIVVKPPEEARADWHCSETSRGAHSKPPKGACA